MSTLQSMSHLVSGVQDRYAKKSTLPRAQKYIDLSVQRNQIEIQ